ncbi:MAG: hypothetical protein HWN67_04390 [Candidatus Helarchaeota archaeon]|nr:hypothetical protein [Candidatus Helarchaeota archaeon]
MRNATSFIVGIGIIIVSIGSLSVPRGILGVSTMDTLVFGLLVFLGIFSGLLLYYGAFKIDKKILILGLIIGFSGWVSLLFWLTLAAQAFELAVIMLNGILAICLIFDAPLHIIVSYYFMMVPPFNVTLANIPIIFGLTVINMILACLSFIKAIIGEEFKRKKEEKIAKSEEEYQKLKEDAAIYIKKISSIYDNVSFGFISSKTELKKDDVHRLIEDLLHKEEISGRIKGDSIIFKEEEKEVKKSKFPINCPQCHYFFNKFHVPTQVLEGKFDYRQPVYCPKCKEEFTLFISKNPDTGRLDIQYT